MNFKFKHHFTNLNTKKPSETTTLLHGFSNPQIPEQPNYKASTPQSEELQQRVDVHKAAGNLRKEFPSVSQFHQRKDGEYTPILSNIDFSKNLKHSLLQLMMQHTQFLERSKPRTETKHESEKKRTR
eukprot:1600532-Amphidinium_carterae.1